MHPNICCENHLNLATKIINLNYVNANTPLHNDFHSPTYTTYKSKLFFTFLISSCTLLGRLALCSLGQRDTKSGPAEDMQTRVCVLECAQEIKASSYHTALRVHRSLVNKISLTLSNGIAYQTNAEPYIDAYLTIRSSLCFLQNKSSKPIRQQFSSKARLRKQCAKKLF